MLPGRKRQLTAATKLYFDRVEAGRAVLISGGEEFSIPLALLPPEAREGDHLEMQFTVDGVSRSQAGAEIAELQQRLRQKNGGEQGA